MGKIEDWNEDVTKHGLNAYKHWHSCGARDYPEDIFYDFDSNQEVLECILYGDDDEAKRK